MLFRRSQPPPDLERAARVLGAGSAPPSGPLRRSADREAAEPSPEMERSEAESSDAESWEAESWDAELLGFSSEDAEQAGGWVPSPPGSSGPADVPGGPSPAPSGGAAMPSGGALGRRSAGQVGSAVRRLTARATDDEVSLLDADLRRARRPGLLTVPDQLRTGRRGFSSAAVVSLLALVVAVACAFVLRVLWAERSASGSEQRAPAGHGVQVVGGTAAGAAGPAAGAGAWAQSSASASAESTSGGGPPGSGPSAGGSAGSAVVVHVVGQVNRPGLVRLRPGARVADAISAAGGARPGADLSVLNLARLVQDGEQLRVPRPGEAPVAGAGAPGGGAGAASGPGTSSGSGGPVSLNTADAASLDALPGVGPVLAQRIVDWRTEHGRFTSVDELGEVSGIGDKLMAQLRPKVTL
ncbi:ComEA family DNA-binding protein [Terrabacter lapilli]